MFSGTHSLKRAPSLWFTSSEQFEGTWHQSDEVGAGEDRNHELVKQRGLDFRPEVGEYSHVGAG